MTFSEVLPLILVSLITILLLSQLCFTYWYRRGVETVLPVPFFGNIFGSIFKKEPVFVNLHNFYNTLKKRGRKFGGYYFLMRPIFVPIDVNLIRGMITSNFDHFTDHIGHVNEEKDPLSLFVFNLKGERWRGIRTKLSPSFTSGKNKMMFGILTEYAEECRRTVSELINKNEPIDVSKLADMYTTDVIVSCGFGIESKVLRNSNLEYKRVLDIFRSPGLKESLRMVLFFLFPEVLSVFNIKIFPKEVTSFFINLMKETIKHREENNTIRKDFMHLLLQIRNNVAISDCEVGEIKSDGKNGRNVGLSLNEMAAQCFAFYAAGFETSATTISFTLTELALNLEIQNKARDEISSILDNFDGKITYEAVMQMEYLTQCVYESLRKYPPVPVNTRVCTKPFRIPNSDVILREGTYVFLPTYSIHRDPEYFPDPEKFEPERFSNRQSSAFMPFGEGPRKCIGYAFGILQIKVVLAVLLSHFNFFVHPDTKTPIEFSPIFTLRPLSSLKLTAEQIKN